jgi:murein hydrolase activator
MRRAAIRPLPAITLQNAMRTQFSSLLLLTFLTSGHAAAEDIAAPQNELGQLEQQLTLSAEEQARIKADVEEAQADQEAISARLVIIGKTIQSQEAAIGQAESKIKSLQKKAVVIRADLAAKQDVLSELLAGLQRLEQNPPPALVVEPDDVLAALRGAMMFGAIVPELRGEAEKLAFTLAELEDTKTRLETEKTALARSTEALKVSQAELDGLIDKKKQLVSEGAAKLNAEKERNAELADKAQNLKQLIADLEAARKREETAAAKKMAAEEIEKKRQQDLLSRPRIAFTQTKRKLEYPAQGKIVMKFGDSDGLGGKLRGVAIATLDEARVMAPADGKIEFAGPFRSYGQLIILNAGEGYLVLLAGMGDITTEIGQTVRAGEPLATMGRGPSSVTLLGDQVQEKRPVLYIELRKNGDAIDSSPWWIGGTKEAMR